MVNENKRMYIPEENHQGKEEVFPLPFPAPVLPRPRRGEAGGEQALTPISIHIMPMASGGAVAAISAAVAASPQGPCVWDELAGKEKLPGSCLEAETRPRGARWTEPGVWLEAKGMGRTAGLGCAGGAGIDAGRGALGSLSPSSSPSCYF